MRMYKTVLLLGLFGVVGNVGAVQITPQIQSLLDQKAAKVAELEKCDKNRKGFMIAGISTLGLTAVGIGGNIALANKNKKLDAELTDKKSELASKKKELSNLQWQQQQNLLQNISLSDVPLADIDFNTVDISAGGTSECFRNLSGLCDENGNYDEDGECRKATLATLGVCGSKSGLWGVVMPYGDIVGKSVCSEKWGAINIAATDAQENTLTTEFNKQSGVGESALNKSQYYCWCKMTHPAVSHWVFSYNFVESSDCVNRCARRCSGHVLSFSDFRAGLFNSVAQ